MEALLSFYTFNITHTARKVNRKKETFDENETKCYNKEKGGHILKGGKAAVVTPLAMYVPSGYGKAVHKSRVDTPWRSYTKDSRTTV